jgi:hypothetical protein
MREWIFLRLVFQKAKENLKTPSFQNNARSTLIPQQDLQHPHPATIPVPHILISSFELI